MWRLRTLHLLIAGVLAGNAGCAVAVRAPHSHLESPEVTGGTGKFILDAGISRNTNVNLTNDYTISAPNTEQPTIKMDPATPGFSPGVTLWDRVELKLKNLRAVSGKVQLLGAPYLSAEAGNLSAALVGTIASGGITESASTYANTLDDTTFDLLALTGLRVNENSLFYGGLFHATGSFEGTWTNSTGSTLGYAGSIETNGATLGVELSWKPIRLQLEGTWSRVTSGSSARNFASVAANFVLTQL